MPDKKITFEQAVRIAASATGYMQIAEIKGGFYGGYMTIAADKDMLDGLSRDTTGENLAALVFNMLCTPMLDFEGVSGDSVEYSAVDEDNTLLNRHWNILKREGFVTETGYSTYTGAGALGKGRVAIDDVIFYAGATMRKAISDVRLCISAMTRRIPAQASLSMFIRRAMLMK